MWSCIHRRIFLFVKFKLSSPRTCSTKQNDGSKFNSKSFNVSNTDIPETPTTCCMSACPNCVWIEYANRLNEMFRDGGEKSLKIIEEKVTDPNMKAFLITELKIASMKK